MYTAEYKQKITEDGKESATLFAKFRFRQEIAPKDWGDVEKRIINFCKGEITDGERNYLVEKGFNKNGYGFNFCFSLITGEYEIFLYPRETFIRNGLNIEANSFGKNLSLDKMINLDEINKLILTGKID